MITPISQTNEQSSVLSQACFSELRAIYQPTQLALANKKSFAIGKLSFGYFVADELIASVDVKCVLDELHFSALAVSRFYRRQGVAKKLLLGVIEQFTGIRRASVWCVEQAGNVPFFESLGFNVVQKQVSDFFELTAGGNATEVQLTLLINEKLL